MKALVTGITGQTGSYLAEILLEEGYEVIGVVRRCSIPNTGRIDHIIDKVKIECGDITDFSSMSHIIGFHKPDLVFNLGAMSHVGVSFEQPLATFESTALGCINILEVLKMLKKREGYAPRFYQAGTSEMFGNNVSYFDLNTRYDRPFETHLSQYDLFQDEKTPLNPRSPYAVAKLAAHHMTKLYRDAYGFFCSSSYIFNNESVRRGDDFVTKKITNYVRKVAKGEAKEKLQLGNLEACRDWSHAKDMARGIFQILTHDKPDDFVLASGKTHSIKELLKYAFGAIGVYDYTQYVEVNEKFIRPAEVPHLRGRPDKAIKELGWKQEYTFEQMIEEMVNG